jgi:nitrite reductase (NADH) small subunit
MANGPTLADGAITYRFGDVNQIPLGEGRVFQAGHIPIAIFRSRTGGVHATQARCPHKAGPLADGITGGNTLVCPLHNYRFNLSTGEPIGNECRALKVYAVNVTGSGDIEVTIERRVSRDKGRSGEE